MKKTSIPDNFAELYDAYFKRAYSFAKSYVHDRYVAEDIASECMMKLYEVLKGEEIKNIPAYLLTLLRNKSLDHLRRLAAQKKAMDDISQIDAQELSFRISTLEECDPNIIFSKEIQEIINATLAQLPAQTRKVFNLSRYENLSNKEIAAELNISVKSVEYHITKSLSSLRSNLKDYLPMSVIMFIF